MGRKKSNYLNYIILLFMQTAEIISNILSFSLKVQLKHLLIHSEKLK